ncbi:hypothetical protein ACSBR2_035386 [Camellia fascicularis]
MSNNGIESVERHCVMELRGGVGATSTLLIQLRGLRTNSELAPAMAARVAFFVVATALLLIHTNAVEVSELTSGERQETPGFSYTGNTGPSKWGSLNPHYATCSTGKSQSPINIVTNNAVLNAKLKPLKREYHIVNATLVNSGYSIEMKFGNAGQLTANGKIYTFQQLHWHTPSEHTIDGVSADAEVHLVHKANDGSLTVIAMLYKIGDADPIIAKFENQLHELAEENCKDNEVAQVAVDNFDAWKLRRNTRKYYRYVGSLTTPPCSENVIWNVFPKIRSISKAQIEALKAPLQPTSKSNSRLVQPLNGRSVELYDELN